MFDVNKLSVSECNRLFNCLTGLSSTEKILFMNCTRNNNCKDALYQLLVYLNPRTGTYQKNNIEVVYKSFPYVNNLRKNLSRLGINSDNFDAVIVEKARSVGINISDSKGNKKEASNVNRGNFEKENRKPDNTINFKLQSKDSQINSICQKLISEINKITSLKDKIYFVNAGRMNHGKSSLFNALAHQRNLFKTGDVRTTTEQQCKEFTKDIVFIDTPGLDVKEKDDIVAFEGYKKADLIIFVHTPNIGELHRNEIDRINQIAALFPSKNDFWQRFCFVFTFKESIEDNQFDIIKSKVLEDIKIHCGGTNYPVFNVSNMDYWDGIDNKSKPLVEISGIPELRTFLLDIADNIKNKAVALRKNRIEDLKLKATKDLKALRREIDDKISRKVKEIERKNGRIQRAKNEIQQIISEQNYFESYMNQEIDNLGSDIARLKNKHAKECN